MQTVFNVILYSLVGLYAVLLVTFIAVKKSYLKPLNLIFILLGIVYVVVRLIILPAKIKNYESLSDFWFYFSTVILIAIVVLLAVFLGKKENGGTKSVSYAGMCIALSYALSFIKIEFLGGAITLASALPLIIYSYCFGIRNGLKAGVIFGILQFMQKPTVYHFLQVVVDYPVAFGMIGLGGIFRYSRLKPVLKFAFGATVGLFGRYISHVVSGYFVFYIYAGDTNPLVFSLIQNTNVLIDLSIVLVVGILLFSSKSFNSQTEKINPPISAD